MSSCPVCDKPYLRTQGPNAQGESFYEHSRPWRTFCVGSRNDDNERKRNRRGGDR